MADFDPSAMQGLLQIISSSGLGVPPKSGIQDYVPRQDLPVFNQPYQGMSFGQLLAPLGTLASSLGIAGDIFGQTSLPGLMSRLNTGNGSNLMMMQRQQQAMRETMRFSSGLTGQQVVSGLGLDPNSALGQTAQFAMPFIDAFAPEMASDIYSAITPTAISRLGGQKLVSASMMRDSRGRLSSENMDSMKATMLRMGTSGPGGKFRNDEFTHGFNFDQFSSFVEMAADLGINDEGFDRRGSRDAARTRALGGRSYSALSADERLDVDRSAQRDVDSEGLMRAGSLQSRIGRQLQAMTGGTAGEAANMMASMGLTASNEKESVGISRVLRELEALGNAAGMTAQNMLNAGRVLQAQNGGSLLFNTQVAATAAMNGRMAKDMVVSAGGSASTAGIDVMTASAANAASAFAGSGYSDINGRVMAVAHTEKEKNDYAQLVKRAGEGDKGAVQQYLAFLEGASTGTGSDLAKRVFNTNLSDEMQQVYNGQFEKTLMANGVTDGGQVASARARVMSNMRALGSRSPLGGLMARYGEDGVRRMYQAAVASQEGGEAGIIKAGFAAKDADVFMGDVMGRGAGSYEQNTLDALATTAVADTPGGRDRIRRDAARSEAATKLNEALRSRGKGQGAIPNLAAGNIHSMADVLEAQGWFVNEQDKKLLDSNSKEDQDEMIAASNKRLQALATLDNSKASQKERSDALKSLQESSGVLTKGGVTEQDDKVKRLLEEADGKKPDVAPMGKAAVSLETAATKLLTAAEIMMGGKAPAGKQVGAPGSAGKASMAAPTGNMESVPGSSSEQKPLSMKVEIDLKQNGKPLDHGQATAKIVKTHGFKAAHFDGEVMS